MKKPILYLNKILFCTYYIQSEIRIILLCKQYLVLENLITFFYLL